MLLIIFTLFTCFVTCPNLNSINPYDNDPKTKCYLILGCRHLAHAHATKYETGKVKDKISHTFIDSCIRAIWPGCKVFPQPIGHDCHLRDYGSFKKGDVLTYKDGRSSMTAVEDGFLVFQINGNAFFIFYHKDKPPMDLKVLSKLAWPHDKDLLNFKDYYYREASSIRLKKYQPCAHKSIIKYNPESLKFVHFDVLIDWIRNSFDLREHNSNRLKLFHSTLSSTYPGIKLTKIHKLGSRPNVVPLHQGCEVIPPNTLIAIRYDLTTFEPAERITVPQYSTLIAAFEHQESIYCLLLSFDMI